MHIPNSAANISTLYRLHGNLPFFCGVLLLTGSDGCCFGEDFFLVFVVFGDDDDMEVFFGDCTTTGFSVFTTAFFTMTTSSSSSHKDVSFFLSFLLLDEEEVISSLNKLSPNISSSVLSFNAFSIHKSSSTSSNNDIFCNCIYISDFVIYISLYVCFMIVIYIYK